MRRKQAAAGFTLVELLLALGLFSILILALVRLLDTSLNIWNRTESGRDLMEVSNTVVELFASDFGSIDAGPRGDFVGEWVPFDIDGDGVRSAFYPRLRLVRLASAGEILRLTPNAKLDPSALGAIETVWALLPSGSSERDIRSSGILWRGQRVRDSKEGLSFFDPIFFSASGRPAPGALEEVTGGVLWCSIWYATQTSIVHDGWELDGSLSGCAASWDARGAGRPDEELSHWNSPGAGMPEAGELPLLPRRVRFEIELERNTELKLRTRLSVKLLPEDKVLLVRDERRLPPVDHMILIDEEWVRVNAVIGDRVAIDRGQRGTQAAPHDAGTLLHHGTRVVREVSIALHREDWDL